MKSAGQLLYGGFTESLLSEAVMTWTGRLPSIGLLSEAGRPCVAQIPSLEPTTDFLSEVGRPYAGQLALHGWQVMGYTPAVHMLSTSYPHGYPHDVDELHTCSFPPNVENSVDK